LKDPICLWKAKIGGIKYRIVFNSERTGDPLVIEQRDFDALGKSCWLELGGDQPHKDIDIYQKCIVALVTCIKDARFLKKKFKFPIHEDFQDCSGVVGCLSAASAVTCEDSDDWDYSAPVSARPSSKYEMPKDD